MKRRNNIFVKPGIYLLLITSVYVYDGYLIYIEFVWSVSCAYRQKQAQCIHGGKLR